MAFICQNNKSRNILVYTNDELENHIICSTSKFPPLRSYATANITMSEIFAGIFPT